MKALVVDPDRSARAVVKRMLSHVNVDTVEADNGLLALSALEHADPDFVVLEIDMPILGGADCLSAIRQSHIRPDIPVICVTASGTRENVQRMVALGVADFLLKPINPADVLPRIRSLLVRVAKWRQRQSSRTSDSLLIVENDPGFLAFAKPLLDPSFEVLEAASSTSAAITYRDASPKPTVVCLAEGLPLMSEDLLLDVIRKMAIESGTNPPQFYLLARGGKVAADKAARYAGIVRKSLVPQTFVEEFRRVVLREQSPFERLRHIVREGLWPELVTATQQTIGVMIGSEISEVSKESAPECPSGVVAEVALIEGQTGSTLTTVISSGRAEVEKMGSLIVRRPITLEEGANEVLGELANTIAGRMRACLIPHGFELKMGLPEIRTLAPGEAIGAEHDLDALFRCTSGEVFRVSLCVREGPGPIASAEASAAPVAAAEAVTSPPSPDAKATDDVLF